MQEVYPGLFVGVQEDCDAFAAKYGWAVVHACKDPCHKRAVGYSGRSLSQEHAEYLWAERGNHLYLNMVDAREPRYFSHVMIEYALDRISTWLREGKYVLIHCNQGCSRAPALALLVLYTRGCGTAPLVRLSLTKAVKEFKTFYPDYAPGEGLSEHLQLDWDRYLSDGEARSRLPLHHHI